MKENDRPTVLEALASRATVILHPNDRPTMLQNHTSASSAVPRKLAGYDVATVIVDNTGEASLYRVTRNEMQYALKWYHTGIQPKEELLNLLSSDLGSNIMRLVDHGTQEDHFYEVQPYYEKGDLGRICPLTEQYLEEQVVPQVNEGLHILHEHCVIHRDIKPSNIFLSNDGQIVIGDFGISSAMDDNVSVRATTMSRTLGYAAPESATGFVSKETDYYSLGITLLHLFTGIDPFRGMTDMQILFQTINEPLAIPASMPQRLKDLIAGLTCKDRTQRWGYQNVCDWCKHIPVEVPGNSRAKDNVRPYQFNYRKYTDLTSLSMAFANNWDNAKKHLSRGLIEKYLMLYGEEMGNQCISLKELADKDVAVFKLILLMNPVAPLCFRGTTYTSLEAMGIAMQQAWPQMITEVHEMFVNGCLDEYICRGGFDEALHIRLRQLMSYAQQDDRNGYFGLIILLNHDAPYEMDDLRANGIDELVVQLEGQTDDRREALCKKILDDSRFIAWMIAKGCNDQLIQWHAIYAKVEVRS